MSLFQDVKMCFRSQDDSALEIFLFSLVLIGKSLKPLFVDQPSLDGVAYELDYTGLPYQLLMCEF